MVILILNKTSINTSIVKIDNFKRNIFAKPMTLNLSKGATKNYENSPERLQKYINLNLSLIMYKNNFYEFI